MTGERRVAVVGSGALARALCRSLAAAPAAGPIDVTVLARDPGAADEVARIGQLRAAVSGTAVTFAAAPLAEAVAVLRRSRPALAVCCASTQSPYERVTAPSAWTDLVARAGFGVTLALQAGVAVPLARALAEASPDTRLVNGAFPDAVNPLLAALGLPVACGIGNVATLAACVQAALGEPDRGRVALLGHHVHLAAPADPADEVRAWHDGVPLAGVGTLLAPGRALPRRELNAVAGHAAARLLVDLLDGAPTRTSLPGPAGLPGGYPVRIADGEITLDLPAGLDRAEAVAWNQRVGRADGVTVHDGRVGHPPETAERLAAYLPDLAAGWPVSALDEVAARLTAVRQRLRLAPHTPVADAPTN